MLTAATIARISIAVNETFRTSTPLQRKRIDRYGASFFENDALTVNTHVVTLDVWSSELQKTKQWLSLGKIAIENL